MTIRDVIPWPSREEFLAWGMVPCRINSCRGLINPYAERSELCVHHLRRARRRDEQERQEERLRLAAATEVRLQQRTIRK